jgi:ABC-type dipeptide/oligopeptide/nickel transport system permease component
LIATVIVTLNFVADIIYSLLDPRVSTTRQEVG